MTRIATMNDRAGGAYRTPMGSLPTEAGEPEVRTGPVSKGGFEWAKSLKRSLTGEAVSQKLLLVVTSQLAVMLASGCDLCAGLDALAKQQPRKTLRRQLVDLLSGVNDAESE